MWNTKLLVGERTHLRAAHKRMLAQLVAFVVAFPERPQQPQVVQLFRKPQISTGRLEIVEEGLDVLRAQTAPFAIVAAAGPTRTGKSSILDHAFIRGRSGKGSIFDVGDGVVSHTTGIWMTREPMRVGELNIFIIDTEGFGGIGSFTSRTYEANLFGPIRKVLGSVAPAVTSKRCSVGITYMLSSVVIYNTMYPIDANAVKQLEGSA